jgi:catalase (peroxidase I)
MQFTCSVAVLTTDVALLHDPEYLHWVKVYAESEETLRHAFKHGEKLLVPELIQARKEIYVAFVAECGSQVWADVGSVSTFCSIAAQWDNRVQ